MNPRSLEHESISVVLAIVLFGGPIVGSPWVTYSHVRQHHDADAENCHNYANQTGFKEARIIDPYHVSVYYHHSKAYGEDSDADNQQFGIQ